MAYLINRNPAARFECLHALVKLIYSNYGTKHSFSLNDVKYNSEEDNVHNYCTLLKQSDFDITYCPYLQNPLSAAGCNMTNGIDCDTTKSKEVSNTINALHALGFVTRNNRSVILTQAGKAFAECSLGTKEAQQLISEAVVRYGPAIGVLKQITDLANIGGVFSTRDIYVGYPKPTEKVDYHGFPVYISSGSQDDSNTRTKSCILAWLTAGGYIRPRTLEPTRQGEFPHFKFKDYLNQPHRGESYYQYVTKAPFANDSSFITSRPLDYDNLTKLTGALRENDMAPVREATMLYEPRIKNRRLAIVYLLNKAYQEGKTLNLKGLLNFFEKSPSLFIVSATNHDAVVQEELKIADMAGIPFDILDDNKNILLKPVAGLDVQELTHGAPEFIIQLLSSFTL